MAAVAAAAKKKQEEEDARPPPGMAPKAAVKPQAKVKGLFWQKMKNSELGGTLWHLLDEPVLSEAERRLLEDCFAAKQANAPVAAAALPTAAATAGAAADKQVSLLDGKRTQNVLILLGKLRKTPEELTQLVVALDPAQLDHELTRTLLEVLPSAEGERAPSSPVRRSSLTRVLMRRIRRGAGVRRARAAGRGVSVRAAVSPGAAAAGAAGVPRSRLQLAGRLPGRRGAAGRRQSRVRRVLQERGGPARAAGPRSVGRQLSQRRLAPRPGECFAPPPPRGRRLTQRWCLCRRTECGWTSSGS